jgi:hypothetical protein
MRSFFAGGAGVQENARVALSLWSRTIEHTCNKNVHFLSCKHSVASIKGVSFADATKGGRKEDES